MSDPIRFGVIGAGAIAGSSCKSINQHDHASVLAASDLNEQRLRELCSEHSIERSYATSDELIADPDLDAIYIGVPNKFHAPLAIQALKAGKHVILDKPFAMNMAEAEDVAAAAKAAGKLFMVGMNQRFRDESQTVRALVEQGQLGEVYHGKAFWFRRTGIPKLGTWFGNKAIAGGGCLLDIGVHLLDLCLYLMDNFEPVSVTGATYTKFGNRGLGEGGWGKSDREDITFDVDDFASALIKFSNGATVTLDVSWACYTEEANRMDVHLYGTEGGAGAYPAKLFRRDPLCKDIQVVTDLRPQTEVSTNRFHNFINAINGDEKPLVTLEQALTVQRILDGIYESCRTGREVRFDTATVTA